MPQTIEQRMRCAYDMLTEAIEHARALKKGLSPVVSDDILGRFSIMIELMRDSKGECYQN